jgi:hypothetical protein
MPASTLLLAVLGDGAPPSDRVDAGQTVDIRGVHRHGQFVQSAVTIRQSPLLVRSVSL